MAMDAALLASKRAVLDKSLRTLGRTLLAYSGGVDSAFLVWAAHQVLGDDMLAVIADSPSLARTQLADAIAFAGEHQIPLKVIATNELDRPEYSRNDASRCFFCKDELFTMMEDFRREHRFESVAYGVNLDDEGDFRPGQVAAEQHRVAAPLRDARLTKQDIRDLARAAALRIWNKPASACLSSRIEYGRPVTREALSIVEQGRRPSRPRVPAVSCAPSRRDCAHRDSPRRAAARSGSRNGCHIHRYVQSPGLQVCHA